MVQYMDHLAMVHIPEVLVVPMRGYDLVLGLPWLTTRKPEIDGATGRLTLLRPSNGQWPKRRSGLIVQGHECRDDDSTNVRLPDIGASTLTINSTSEITLPPDGKPRESGEDSHTPDIKIIGAIAFNELLTSDESIETFALHIGVGSGLLGVTMEVTILEYPGEIETINPKSWTCEQGAAAVVVAEKHPQIIE
jgi:hypothetical protein